MNENNDSNDMSKQTGRHVHWWMIAVFSTVALVALVTEYEGDLKDQGREVKWSVSAISIVLSFSWLAVMANTFVSSTFASTMIEGGVVSLARFSVISPISSLLNCVFFDLSTAGFAYMWLLGCWTTSDYES
jgi:apolipoprotein N-acyltransferase